ncbi:MAG TPA: O-antigen ligase family protein [Candidatus Methylomirabilis sp.]|nr:O-antigen ligase family protein [Candidatus Methylomirabilis sp.]
MSGLHRVLLVAFVAGLGFSITLSESALAMLSALWLWRLGTPGGRARAAWPLAAPVAAFAAATLLSAALSGHPAESLRAAKDLLLALALYVTADGLPDADGADRFLSALALVAAAAAAMGLLQVGLCPRAEPAAGLARWFFHRCDRARGPFSIYMTLAGVLNIVLLATAPRLLAAGRRWAGPAWLITLAGLAATLTRGAWIGLVAGVLTLLPTSRRGRWLLLGILLAAVATAVIGPAALRQRVVSMSDAQDPTVREREYMWQSGVAMWREHPLLGWGPGGVKREYSRFVMPGAVKTRTGHLHNVPLQILVERGALGLAAWMSIWLAFYARVLPLLRSTPLPGRERALITGSVAALTGFLVAGLSENNFGDSEVALVAWTVVALPFAVERARALGAAAPSQYTT